MNKYIVVAVDRPFHYWWTFEKSYTTPTSIDCRVDSNHTIEFDPAVQACRSTGQPGVTDRGRPLVSRARADVIPSGPPGATSIELPLEFLVSALCFVVDARARGFNRVIEVIGSHCNRSDTVLDVRRCRSIDVLPCSLHRGLPTDRLDIRADVPCVRPARRASSTPSPIERCVVWTPKISRRACSSGIGTWI